MYIMLLGEPMIRVTGGTASQRKYIPSVVNFCIKKLMPRMKGLDITVRLKELKGDAYGYCHSDPQGDATRIDRPREFEIEIHSKMPLRKVLETLCHEMVHVKQYARGELYESVRLAKHRWQGKYISNNVDYWDQPWEIEAAGREAGLFIRWAESEGLGKRKWTHDS
jgi:hypothetical protein